MVCLRSCETLFEGLATLIDMLPGGQGREGEGREANQAWRGWVWWAARAAGAAEVDRLLDRHLECAGGRRCACSRGLAVAQIGCCRDVRT